MAIKRYSAFPKAQALLKPYHQIIQCHIQDTHQGNLPPHSAETIKEYSKLSCFLELESHHQGNQLFGGFLAHYSESTRYLLLLLLLLHRHRRHSVLLSLSFLLIVENAIRTNYIKGRIDKTQQNSRCRLCFDRD